MKKLLAVLLALTLSCSFMLSVSAQGEGSASAGNSFEESVKAENWKIANKQSGSYVNPAPETKCCGTNSIEANTAWKWMYTEFSVKKNTNYSLSYAYYYKGDATGVLIHTGVCTAVAENGDDATFIKYMLDRRGIYTGIAPDKSLLEQKEKWTTVSLAFNSGDHEKVYLAIKSATGPIYYDDFLLKEIQYDPNVACQWNIRPANPNDSELYESPTVKDVRTTVYSGISSVQLQVPRNQFSTKFPVEPNTDYCLSFFYYSKKTSTATGLDSVGIIKPGTNLRQQANRIVWSSQAAPEDSQENVLNADETWQKVTFNFNSGNNSELELAMSFYTYTNYIDNVTLMKAQQKKCSDSRTIDFENALQEYVPCTSLDAFETHNVVDEAGKATTALRLSKTDAAKNLATDDLTFSVQPNTNYKFSYSYKFISSPFEGLAANLVNAGSTALQLKADFTGKEAGKWYTVTGTFATAEGCTALGLQIPSGPGSAYLDNFKLELNNENAPVTGMNKDGKGDSNAPAASIRSTDGGLRIKSVIKDSLVSNNSITKFGYVVTSNALLNANKELADLYVDNKIKNVNALAYGGEQVYQIVDTEINGEAFKEFGCVLTNIKVDNYATDFVIRAFAIDKNGVCSYGQSATLSMYDVVYAIDCADIVNDSDKAAAQQIIDSAAGTANAKTYVAWLSENGYTAGKNLTTAGTNA